jgi:ABC-type antimicrobial peptide transport system permease subunit
MSNFDLLSMALRNLFTRKMRTLLTVLGVVIGSTAIIVLTSVGVGVNMSFDAQMNSMQDATTIQIYNYSGYSGQTLGAAVLDDAKIEEIKQIKGVDVVTPYLNSYMYALSGRYQASFQVIGMDLSTMEAFGYRLQEGHFPTAEEKNAVLFGSDLVYQFKTTSELNRPNWTGQISSNAKINVDVLKDKIKLSPDYSLIQPADTSTGSEYVEESGSFAGGNENTFAPFRPINITGTGILNGTTKYDAMSCVFMDINEMTELMEDYTKWQEKAYTIIGNNQETNGYQEAMVKCVSIDAVSEVAEVLNTYGFDSVYNPTAFVDDLKSMMETLQIMLIAIGAVSLFVAAIGIANTMIMSIYERTREIGIMKVIGASIKDIKRLFLVEAALIGLFGGAIGLIISYTLSYVMNNLDLPIVQQLTQGMASGGDISVIPIWLAALAVTFSAFVGVVSGYLPARRATKLSVLNALRTQ